MDEALRGRALGLGVAGHLGWIEGLLSEYYDPMYVYQRQQKASRIVFAGDQAAVTQYLAQQAAAPARR